MEAIMHDVSERIYSIQLQLQSRHLSTIVRLSCLTTSIRKHPRLHVHSPLQPERMPLCSSPSAELIPPSAELIPHVTISKFKGEKTPSHASSAGVLSASDQKAS